MRKAVYIFSIVALLVVGVAIKAQSPQVTWTDASGLAGNCLTITTEYGSEIGSGYYYCPEQPTSFSSPYCPDPANGVCYGSLYLPDLTLEGITTTYGAPFNVTKDSKGRVAAYSRTDSLVENQEGNGPTTWSGNVTQSFTVSYAAYNFRCRCYPATTTVLSGGEGALAFNGTANVTSSDSNSTWHRDQDNKRDKE